MNLRTKPAYSNGSMVQRDSKPHACAKCGRNHSSIFHQGSTSFFKCGYNCHFMRKILNNKQGSGNGCVRGQCSISPPDIDGPRGTTSGITENETKKMLSPLKKSKTIFHMLSLV